MNNPAENEPAAFTWQETGRSQGYDTMYSEYAPNPSAYISNVEPLYSASIVEALQAENAALLSQVEWRPIETAPKDGTEIIGVFSNDYGYQPTPTVYGPWTMAWRLGEWQSSWDEAQVVESMSDFGTTMKSLDIEPTHWMPRPNPPAALEEKSHD